MLRKIAITALFASSAAVLTLAPVHADESETPAVAASEDANPDSKLLIVNGNTGRVIYDDGRDDYYCVYRRRTVGYDEDGYRIRRNTMRCR